ncbi:MAG: symmetrical bis(5'-nucleosyl)-tetraphosphatase [Lysobacterales bacterium]
MTRYVIGDVQGCFDALKRLLKVLRFDPEKDRLWFAGDLVNRGGQSLEVLRFAVKHAHACHAVLGNHDLHLLAQAAGISKRDEPELQQILDADDGADLVDWVRRQPLLKTFPRRKIMLSHAGLHPHWSVGTAQDLAAAVEQRLRGADWKTRIEKVYGGKSTWEATLKGRQKLRAITATLTRMRYLDGKGAFDAENKGPPGSQQSHLFPWFSLPHVRPEGWRVLFGHWATLGYHVSEDAVCLDSGCVWGGPLTAVALRDLDTPIQV